MFDTIKDLNLFVRKLSLKAIHHKQEPNQSGTNYLMQLSLTECRELRDLLLEDMDDSQMSSTPPSSPTPLLEAAEAALNTPQIGPKNPTDSLVPNTLDLRAKSKVFPSSSTSKSEQLFLKLVSNDILALAPPGSLTLIYPKPNHKH